MNDTGFLVDGYSPPFKGGGPSNQSVMGVLRGLVTLKDRQ
jgi:hypothetical protein